MNSFFRAVDAGFVARLLLLSLVSGCCFVLTQEQVTFGKLFGVSVQEAKANFQEEASVPDMNLTEVLKGCRNSQQLIIDVRRPEYYKTGRIRSALNLPFSGSEFMETNAFSRLDKKSQLVVYSNTKQISALAAARLIALGYTNVAIYPEGWLEWKACQLPIEESVQ